MPDSTLDSEKFILIDHWPGAVLANVPVPHHALTDSSHHNVATAKYDLGAKIQLRCDGSVGKAGWSTLIYLQVGTQNPDVAIAAKTFVVPDSASAPYQITNDKDDCILNTGSALAAIGLSAMTDAYYGWFWCGGVCPEQYVSGLGGNYVTDGNVAAGAVVAHALAADAIGLGPCGADTEAIIGFAYAADA